MFRKESFHTIDEKGRVIIPTRFRNVIAETGENAVVVSRLESNCLYAYTLPKWREIEAKVLAMPRTTPQTRRFRTFFIGGAAECPLDKQDRILIPPTLRESVGLEDEIVLVGVLGHFEIWSRKRRDFEAGLLDNDMNSEDFTAQIADLGL